MDTEKSPIEPITPVIPVGVPATRFAATKLPSGANSLSVFYQIEDSGALQQYVWGGSRWTPGATFGAPQNLTAIASVSWVDQASVQHIRVYAQDQSNMICEYAWDGSSWAGPNVLGPAIARTGLAAVSWLSGGTTQIRVYYQDTNNSIQELAFQSGKWGPGTSQGIALGLTQIAAVSWLVDSIPQICVYFQDTSLDVQEHRYQGTWLPPVRVYAQAAPRSGLGAVAWSNGGQRRVYLHDLSYAVCEVVWAGSSWNTSGTLAQAVSNEVTAIAAVCWPASPISIRVYYQAVEGQSNAVREQGYDGQSWFQGQADIPVDTSV